MGASLKKALLIFHFFSAIQTERFPCPVRCLEVSPKLALVWQNISLIATFANDLAKSVPASSSKRFPACLHAWLPAEPSLAQQDPDDLPSLTPVSEECRCPFFEQRVIHPLGKVYYRINRTWKEHNRSFAVKSRRHSRDLLKRAISEAKPNQRKESRMSVNNICRLMFAR